METYTVTRLCCTSGQCIDCHRSGKGKPARVVHAVGVSKELAEKMVSGWSAYAAQMAPDATKDDE